MKDKSANAVREVSCDGKHPYESKSLAAQVAGRGARAKGTAPTPYKCAFCNKWHVGTPLRDRRSKQQQVRSRA